LNEFVKNITEGINIKPISTGFKKLDSSINGGLTEGLYILGAVSSLGKTTFVTEIAENIAKNKQDVIIFSLEMSKTEIISRIISKNTFKNTNFNINLAKSAKEIMTISKMSDKLIFKTIEDFGIYSKNLFINEDDDLINTIKIKETIQNHIKFRKTKPVIIIDYLQILAPVSKNLTDKQNIDRTTLELKKISRKFHIPVIAVSSLNRASYNQKVTMESFKESGAIEYSSDVLIGLQLRGAGERGFNMETAKSKNPREVELVVLKNRNGEAGKMIDFLYYPKFNYFEELKIEI